MATEKPPYRIPSMEEIAAVRGSNGLTVISTFSGCGGSCLGFEMAGYDVRVACEFVGAARETYAANHPGVPLLGEDIRKLAPEDLLRAAGLERGEVDVLEGSPPCSSFSTAGKRSRGWGQSNKYSDTSQRTDDLFFEFARLLEGIQPRVFVAENVSGLIKGASKGYFKEIHKRLGEAGYVVGASLLDAQWLGVPQARSRVIFVGVRNDLGKVPAFPAPLPYRYTVRDALPWLTSARAESHGPNSWANDKLSADSPAPAIVTTPEGASWYRHSVEGRLIHDTSGEWGAGDVTDRPAPAVTVGVNSVNQRHFQVEGPETGDPLVVSGYVLDPETQERIDLMGTAISPEAEKLAPGESSDRFFSLVRPHADRPLPTATQAAGGRGTAGVLHPTGRRKLTLLELRRLCGFPDDFVLTGTYAQRWERLGRAVPPPMMRAVAEAVRDGVLA